MIWETVLAGMSDPTTLPLWGVLILAAAMYPLGMMLGSPCSPCCTPCGCPVGEQLPDAIKVTFSGLTSSAIFERDLISLSIESCFGSGASGKVTAAGDGVLTPGPITAVTLTNPGSGYAVLGRIQPTDLSLVSIGGGSDQGAEYNIVFAQTTDACGRVAWAISEVTIVTPGAGWAADVQLIVQVGENEFEDQPAVLFLRSTSGTLAVEVFEGGKYYKTSVDEPAIVANVTVTLAQLPPSNGAGAILEVEIDSDPTSPTFSQVTGFKEITEGGSGYLAEGYQVNEECCVTSWNGVTVLAQRISPTSCDYEVHCCSRGTVYVRYNGYSELPTVRIIGLCGVDFSVTTELGYSCEEIDFAAEDPFGTGAATVVSALPGDTSDAFPCPGCCTTQASSLQEATEAGKQCTKEDCVSAGYVWQERCECGPCNDCAQEQSLVVDIESFGYLPAIGGGWDQVTRSYTLTLNAENNWSDATAGFNYMPGQVNGGAAADVAFGGDEQTACAVYVIAHGNDPAPPTSAVPGFCWNGDIVGYPQPAGIRVPSANGCFTDGAAVNCTPENPPGLTGGAAITVTLVTA